VRSKPLTKLNGPNIDPLVQADFVDQLLTLIEETSPNLKSFATQQRELLRQGQVVGLSWRNVLDDNAKAGRPKAQRALEAIRQSYPSAQKLIDDHMGSLKTWSQLANYRPVGVIYKKGEQWIADVEMSVKDGQPLYCILPGRRDSASFDKIGTYASGIIDQGNSVLPLQAGRPIFVLNEQQKN